MKRDIILGGVGGQGILSIATIIGNAAVQKGMYLKQAEVHGMSQRGGDVMSNLRISDDEIYSDLIPLGHADIIIGVEPMEALRHIKMLKKEGWIVTNAKPFINIPDYPNVDDVYNEIKAVKNHILVDADVIAKDLGSVKVSNVVMLGAAAPALGFTYEELIGSIKMIFGRKGDDIVNLNINALKAGIEIANKVM